MAEQLVINNRHRYDQEPEGLNWPRIIGMAFVVVLHVAVFMLLLIPAVAPQADKNADQKTRALIVDPPPPQPQPEIKEIKLQPKPVETPPTNPPPPVTVDVPDTRAIDTVGEVTPQVEAKPEPVRSSVNADGSASVCNKTPMQYPIAAARAQATGTTIVQVTWAADGTITDSTVFKSSRNRDLDRAATTQVKRWTVCPGQPGTGTIKVDWVLE
jgi:protein TonB